MNTKCEAAFAEPRLMEFFDGELNAAQEREVQVHLLSCAHCAAQLHLWNGIGDGVRDDIDLGLETLEPLVALQRIRAMREESPTLWQDLRQRFMAYGEAVRPRFWVMAAVALMLPIPLLLNTVMHNGADQSRSGDISGLAPNEAIGTLASVTIESLEFDGNSRAVVYRPRGSKTTIIWVEPRSDVASN